MNIVVLIGRMVRDPEVRYTNSGMAICTFTVAVDRDRRNTNEVRENEPTADFPRVTVFGKQAEACGKYLTKGRRVGVFGHIKTGSYMNKQDVKVYTTDVVASRVEFIDSSGKGGANAANNQTRAMNGTMNYNGGRGGSTHQSNVTVDDEQYEGFSQIDMDDVPF